MVKYHFVSVKKLSSGGWMDHTVYMDFSGKTCCTQELFQEIAGLWVGTVRGKEQIFPSTLLEIKYFPQIEKLHYLAFLFVFALESLDHLTKVNRLMSDHTRASKGLLYHEDEGNLVWSNALTKTWRLKRILLIAGKNHIDLNQHFKLILLITKGKFLPVINFSQQRLWGVNHGVTVDSEELKCIVTMTSWLLHFCEISHKELWEKRNKSQVYIILFSWEMLQHIFRWKCCFGDD